MVHRKHNPSAGFSLVEVLVAITILGLVVVPIGSSLVLSFRLNARSDQMLQAQLAVSSAVETLMAEGFDPDFDYHNDTRFAAVEILENPDDGDSLTHEITVTSTITPDVTVTTNVRPAPATPEGGGDS